MRFAMNAYIAYCRERINSITPLLVKNGWYSCFDVSSAAEECCCGIQCFSAKDCAEMGWDALELRIAKREGLLMSLLEISKIP